MRFPRRVAHVCARPAHAGRARLRLLGPTLARAVVVLLLPGLAGLVLLVGSTAPVQATPGVDDYPSWLMKRPKDGYVDPWNFYSRECTSFVAWRLYNDNGVKNFSNMYQGHHWGNAWMWKRAALASGVRVDGTPAVGAVAWWAASSTSAGYGHVAWVWKVSGSGDQITIEEYNYLRSGYYDRRTLTRGDRHWPDGFIHVADLGLVNRVAPRATGTPQVGQRMWARKGQWSRKGLDFHFQWRAGGKAIPGATAQRFTVTPAQLGKRLRVRVTATAPGVDSRTVRSARTSRVAPGTFTNPVVPSVSGSAQVGGTLTADPGSWSPDADYSYQWLVEGTPVAGAVASTYSPRPVDVGHPVSVRVTASLDGYTPMQAVSAVTAKVVPGEFSVTRLPSITGTPQVDQQLTAAPGTWSPRGTYTYQWYAGGQPVAGATGRTFTPGPEQAGKVVTVEVTATRDGYTTASRTSAATTAVALGRFTPVRAPRVRGTAQVGVQLRAIHGHWTPAPARDDTGTPAYRYQWLADGDPIAGATHQLFTPGADQVGKRLTVRVTAARPGYAPDTQASTATVPVARGHLDGVDRPTVTGAGFVGEQLSASPGSWSIPVDPADLRYQWFAGPKAIPGADQPELTLTRREVGERIRVRVTAAPAGYVRARQTSTRTDAVLRGRAEFTGTPRVKGHARLGRTLRVLTGSFTPPGTTPSYQWFRGSRAIHGATGTHYTTVRRDLGRRLSVQVSLTPRNWASASTRTERTEKVRSRPRLDTDARVHHHRVRLRVEVSAAGVRTATGRVQVLEGDQLLARPRLREGVASRTLRGLDRGRHRLTLAYTGSAEVARRTVEISVRIR